jgi:hypothetical protein
LATEEELPYVAEEETDQMRQEKHMSVMITTMMTTASEAINGAYILSSVQHNNFLRSHQIIFTATE